MLHPNWIVAMVSLMVTFEVPAQVGYPDKPVRIVGSFAAGGIVDLMARTFSDKLGELLGQPVIVEAKSGANGSIGTEVVARSRADGYTLLLAGTTHVTLPAISRVPWHPTKDFAGIATIGYIPNVVVIPASLPVTSLAEFVAYAKERRGELNALNGGTAGSQNLNTELFKRLSGVEMTAIGYKSLPQGIPDLLSGRLHFAVLPPPLISAHVGSGKLRALAISASERLDQFPDVPTMAEAGYPQASVMGWYALLAPAGTPREVIDRLNVEVNRALADQAVLARIRNLDGHPLPGSTPKGLDDMLVKETERWQALAAEAGIRID